jgi:hypothetical protein
LELPGSNYSRRDLRIRRHRVIPALLCTPRIDTTVFTQ